MSGPPVMGRTLAVALTGMHGHLVEVEADIGQSLPGFVLLGLPDQSLQESRDRIKAAARNSGLPLTRRHLTVNLVPAALHKRGPGFDLAIVMAAYAADHRVHGTEGPVFLAELGLDGRLRHAPGVLPCVMAAVEAGHPEVVVAEESCAEAALVPGARVRGFRSLHEVIVAFGGSPDAPLASALAGPASGPGSGPAPGAAEDPGTMPDLAEVAGQFEARFALEVAAAGGHHLLLEGSPGAGKTMLAERLPGILPPLDDRTALEVTAVRSLSGRSQDAARLIRRAPFQAPHHSASMAALVGGGSGLARPGAASLAHGGVLFLDEAPEFDRRALDALRQPLESGTITLHRSSGAVRYPSRFQLVLAANPCPCGWGGGRGSRCRCSSVQRRRYTARLSGPLLDRVDIQVTVPAVEAVALTSGAAGEGSEAVRRRILPAVTRQAARLRPFGLSRNAHLPAALLRDGEVAIDARARAGADAALDRAELTARGHARVMRLAWTVADLRGADRPSAEDVDTALYLRRRGEGEETA
ncbi:YifB family Mg chelatase-like AAA ATPase [Citricoccus sp. I39-566]|uniref:YifB family Mg chelatase-like AAA ATPase n=1 Tax=Citricoccus sp. I39-566 TaxID=3073268 RepID=UPI00286D4901|nr:YifB family Mg chelatase-like AAA ATPase [Citricoccus sp. I39-566]WMY77100.1 YifB family Mg chelatase-like AAA ATPase [Citricoccus sp. I39-566]